MKDFPLRPVTQRDLDRINEFLFTQAVGTPEKPAKIEDPMHILTGAIEGIPTKDTMTPEDLAGVRAGFHTAWLNGEPAVIYKGETGGVSFFMLVTTLPSEE